MQIEYLLGTNRGRRFTFYSGLRVRFKHLDHIKRLILLSGVHRSLASTTYSCYGRSWNKAHHERVRSALPSLNSERHLIVFTNNPYGEYYVTTGSHEMVSVIKTLYTDVQCQVAYSNHLTDSFSIKTGVKLGCIFLYLY